MMTSRCLKLSLRCVALLLMTTDFTNANSKDLPVFDADNFLKDDLIDFDTEDYFVCDEVATSVAKIEIEPKDTLARSSKVRAKFKHEVDFTCVANPSKSDNGHTKGLHLRLLNLPDGFDVDREEAIAKGMTRLVIRGGAKVDFVHSTLHVPDQNDNAEGGYISLKPVLEWQLPPENSTSKFKHSRKLAFNQYGTKDVIVFRISVEGKTPPTLSAAEISDSIFGLKENGDPVNLRTQFNACSFGLIDFRPAGGLVTALYSDVESGVVELSIPSSSISSFETLHIGNVAAEIAQNSTEFGGLDLDLDDYDHVMYVMPPNTVYNFFTNWVAFAYKPGTESYYNDNAVANVLNQVHEVGHNLDLHHSGEGSLEYGDTTDIMGYGDGKDDTRKCFNGAKMMELGYYEHTVTLNPVDNSFTGKLIGVADYGEVTSEHTLVVEVINSDPESNNLYVSYNRKKGINIDTGEYGDMVTIVSAEFRERSLLVGAVGPNSSFRVENFFSGRDLIITFGDVGVDGNSVDTASINIELEVEDCAVANDCSVGTSGCVTATCVNQKCIYQSKDNCCGNGTCEVEAGETCKTCALDCKSPSDCNSISYFDLPKKCTKVIRTGGSWDPAGHMFDITAKNDIEIYAFEIMYSGTTFSGETLDFIYPEIYSKRGTWIGSQFSKEAWVEHRGPTPFPVVIPNVTGCLPPLEDEIFLDIPIRMKAGETVGIYITLQKAAQLWMRPATNYVKRRWESVGFPFVENSDIALRAGVAPEYPFGLYIDFMGWPAYFIGRVKYNYGVQCDLNSQCNDGNSNTTDTCDLNTNECYFDVGPNVGTCGNSICEPEVGENCYSCALDCKIPEDCKIIGLGINEFGEGWINGYYRYKFNTKVSGNMFDVIADEDLTIEGFEIYTFRDEYQDDQRVEIYTRKGTFQGVELKEAAWLQIMKPDKLYTFEKERIVLQLDNPVRMYKNEQRAFYITIHDTWTLNYGEGSGSTGGVLLEDKSLRILEGIVLEKEPFAKVTFPSAKFYGSIQYSKGHQCYDDEECDDGDPTTSDECVFDVNSVGSCRNQVIMNVCGNRVCETSNGETWLTCDADCSFPDQGETGVVGLIFDDEWPFSSYSNQNGMMFDVKTKSKSITAYGIDIPRTGNNHLTYETFVYVTRINGMSHVGVQNDPDKWILVAHQNVTLSKSGRNIVLDYPFTMEAFETRGVYITFEESGMFIAPTNSLPVGEVVSETEDLQLLVGSFNKFGFGKYFEPWTFYGRVRYFIEGLPCKNDLECNDNNIGTEDKCINSKCINNIISGVCGNGVCEERESCQSCPQDCAAPNNCDELDTNLSVSSSSSGVYGIIFEIEAKRDITFYELSASIMRSSTNVMIYSRSGSWSHVSTLDGFIKYYDGSVSTRTYTVELAASSIALLTTPMGTRRTFYITYSSSFTQPLSGDVQKGDIQKENTDMILFVGGGRGTNIGTSKADLLFAGSLSYDFGLNQNYCDVASDCDDDNEATLDTCTDKGICKHSVKLDVCGNLICEQWNGESCLTCPTDCFAPIYCDEVDSDPQLSGSSTASNVRGVVFDVDAMTDISIHRISLRTWSSSSAVNVQVYHVDGSYDAQPGLDNFNLVADIESVTQSNRIIDIALDEKIVINANARKAIYVRLSSGSYLSYRKREDNEKGLIVEENDDIKIFTGVSSNEDYSNEGTIVNFRGVLHYLKSDVPAPSFKPSISMSPSTKNTNKPTAYPTLEPRFFGDSIHTFKIIANGMEKWHDCAWVREKPDKRCSDDVASHCPLSCQVRVACMDSKLPFAIDSDRAFVVTCDTIASILNDPCQANDIENTCTRLCARDVDGVLFYNKDKSNGKPNTKDCKWLQEQSPAVKTEVCNKDGKGGFPSASEVCADTCETNCDAFPNPAPTAAPSHSPTKVGMESCRREAENDLFFYKLKDDDSTVTKSCGWLKKLARKAERKPSKKAKLIRLCQSTDESGIFKSAGEVCMETCENHKLFIKNVDGNVEKMKTCEWLANPNRDNKRSSICGNNPLDAGLEKSPILGLKPASTTCFMTCETCP